MLEVFYKGFAFTIYRGESSQKYYSEITLESDKKFHFWQDDQTADTCEDCLFKTMESCRGIIKDYGFAPIVFNPVDWDVDPDILNYF